MTRTFRDKEGPPRRITGDPPSGGGGFHHVSQIYLSIFKNFGHTPWHMGPRFPDQGSKPGPPAKEGGVLTTGLLNKAPNFLNAIKKMMTKKVIAT